MFLSRIFVFNILISFEICKVCSNKDLENLPIAINTWAFTNATKMAWKLLIDNKALDALVEGCSVCESEQCDGTVGYGGSPDENGETTLDAMIIDGSNMNMGAVGSLREVKHAIKVARFVLENTQHSLLVGELATKFALEMGFERESLSTKKSTSLWQKWKSNNCQPNFWENVSPDPRKSCGPYLPNKDHSKKQKCVTNIDDIPLFGKYNHDTISMIVIDIEGHIFAGTSTNGAIHKIPGRIGDSPIPGAGAYANNEYGAAGATGDGDIMMRFLPSFEAVQHLKSGYTPQEAAQKSIQSILRYYPKFVGAIIVVNKYGEYSAACSGMEKFPFSVRTLNHLDVSVEYVNCKI